MISIPTGGRKLFLKSHFAWFFVGALGERLFAKWDTPPLLSARDTVTVVRYQLIAFDLDDTLAPSKGSLPAPMSKSLANLVKQVPISIISGGRFAQFQSQLLDGLELPSDLLERLHLMPTCGTRYYRFIDSQWTCVYAHDLTDEEKEQAISSLTQHAKELNLWESQTWGPVIEDRQSQITFSALGQSAPIDAKRAWDPDGSKKARLVEAVATDLPSLEVRGGGSTSVDITAKGVDKAYGMNMLCEVTGIAKEDMLFIGDRLDERGNDYPVKAAGWATLATKGWEDTVDIIQKLLEGKDGDEYALRAVRQTRPTQ